jgi:myosin heavy subunit
LREELGRRSAEINALEQKAWASHEDVHRERLENVRMEAELARIREEVERSRCAERERTSEVERLAAELRKMELERSDMAALLRSREDELARLGGQRNGGTDRTEDEMRAKLEQLHARADDAAELAEQRQAQLEELRAERERLQQQVDERGTAATRIQSRLDVKTLEVHQLSGSLVDLQARVEQQRTALAHDRTHAEALQRSLERSASEQEGLRRRLREREQELETLGSTRGVTSAGDPAEGSELAGIRRFELELEIRVREQEIMVGLLEAAEQRVWELTDAEDRSAARFAASLARLEKYREQLEDTQGELEVTRKLLAAAQARALEQERLLASERAKLVRVGVRADPANSSGNDESIDSLFAELEVGDHQMVDLKTPPPVARGDKVRSRR